MSKVNSKRRQKIDFNEYLARVRSLTGDALKEWNRESLRRSRLLQKETFEARKSNIQRYLETPGAEDSLAAQTNHSGEITLKWRIHLEPGECRLRVNAGGVCTNFELLAGSPISDRVTAKRFMSIINQHLVAASLSLIEASAIYSSERVHKSDSRSWHGRFMNEQIHRLEELTGKPRKFGRPTHTRKNCLQKEDETKDLKADVILAMQNLYNGVPHGAYYCPKHKRGVCPGHDFEEMDIPRVAGYLNRNAGTLRNQLSKAKLKFPDLKKEALAGVIN